MKINERLARGTPPIIWRFDRLLNPLQARKPRRRNSLMVYANLKSPAHSLGMQQRFEKQSCTNFLDFAGVGRV